MKRLSKTEQYNQTLDILESNIIGNTNIAKTKQEAVLQQLQDAFRVFAPNTPTNPKINVAGHVYCNYFEEYLPASEFKTKTNKKKYNKLVESGLTEEEAYEQATTYRANSAIADEIIRTAKYRRKKLEAQTLSEYRFGRVTPTELDDMLAAAKSITHDTNDDLVIYPTVEDIPRIWDVLVPIIGKDNATITAEEAGEKI